MADDNVGIVGYSVYRDGLLISSPSGLTYRDSGLNPSSSYCYTVQAVDAAGNRSGVSNQLCVDTDLDSLDPDPPTSFVVEALGSSDLRLNWGVPYDDTGVVAYRVFKSGTEIEMISTTVYTDTGLDPETNYCYSVAALDLAGRLSNQTGQQCGTTLALMLPDPVGSDVQDPEAVSFCFIATAAFGSPLEPSVEMLRIFRDRFLLFFDLGRVFVKFYEQYSPPLADDIVRDDSLRAMVRVLLWPLVGMVWLWVKASIGIKVGLLSFLGGGWALWRMRPVHFPRFF